ncbi:MAG TPA: hypothetical protein VF174_06820 [Micromonosporaceae bacterium]
MTTEIGIPEQDPRRPVPGPGGRVPPMPPPMSGPPAGVPVGPPMAGPASRELQFVDQLRRGFQVRRFGSGYDPAQVDRLFEGILAALAGHGPMPVNPAELDTMRFDLVSGGYYENEVDAALQQVKEMLRRR